MLKGRTRIFFLLFSLLFLGFFVNSNKVEAASCPVDCASFDMISCVSQYLPADCESCYDECWPSCPYQEPTSISMSECLDNLGPPDNTCAGESGANSKCGWLGAWGYCYASDCKVQARVGWPGECHYDYQYSYIDCSAQDSCLSGPYLYAGRCSDTGCTKGGLYKTCCEISGGSFTGNLGGDCQGGNYGGNCPAGSGAVMCGVDQATCDTVIAKGYSCTTAPCGLSACQAVGSAPPPTGEPPPTEPPAGSCPDNASWCTNPDYCVANGCTVYDTPDGACSVSGDICCGCPSVSSSKIKVNIKGVKHQVGDPVIVEVYQEPKKYDDSACYYDSIDVKVNNPGGTLLPPDFIVCRAKNFQDKNASNKCDFGGDEGRCRTCIWDTNNIQAAADDRADKFPVRQYPTEPSGYYIAGVWYGGHSDPVCSDSTGSASDNTTLEGESEIWVDPSEGCPEGTVMQEIDISGDVDAIFNTFRGWEIISGNPGVMCDYYNCCYRSRGDECDEWGDCAGIRRYSGNYVTDKEECDPKEYTIKARITIPGEDIGKEYVVSVMGTGVKAERAGHSGSDDGYSLPYMRLVSGNLTTKNLKFGDCCIWKKGAYKMVAQAPWLDIYLISDTVEKTHGTYPPQAAFDSLKVYQCAPVPSCTVDLVPSSATIYQEGKIELEADVSDLQNGSVSEIEFSSSNPEIAMIESSGDLSAIVSGIAQGGPVTMTANVYLDPGHVLGCSDDSLITVTYPHAWFQTQGGDVYGQSGVSSSIPASCAASSSCLEYFSLALYGYAGMVSSSEGTSRNFGSGEAIQGGEPWSVDGDLSWVKNAYSYSYFANLLDVACEEGQGDNNSYNDNVSCSFAVSSVDSKPDFSSYPVYVYQVSSNSFSISNNDWNLGDEKGIVLISFDDPSNEITAFLP